MALSRGAGFHLYDNVQGEFLVSYVKPVQHTLIYANRQWLVFPGLHGRAGRTFRLGLADAVEYQRRVFEAVKKNRFMTWLKFCFWYRSWRKRVSVRE